MFKRIILLKRAIVSSLSQEVTLHSILALFLNLIIIALILSLVYVMLNWDQFTNRLKSNPEMKVSGSEEKEITIYLAPTEINANKDSVIIIKPVIKSSTEKKIGFIKLVVNYNIKHLKFKEIEQRELPGSLKLLRGPDIKESGDTGQVKLLWGITNVGENPPEFMNLNFLNFIVLEDNQTSYIDINNTESSISFLSLENAIIKTDKPVKIDSSIITPTPVMEITPSISPQPSI